MRKDAQLLETGRKFQFIGLFHPRCHCEPVTDVTGVAI